MDKKKSRVSRRNRRKILVIVCIVWSLILLILIMKSIATIVTGASIEEVKALQMDEEPPLLEGVKDIKVKVGDTHIDYLHGVKAIDKEDPSPSLSVDSSRVNFNVAGEYEIIYTAKDRSNNVATKSATVHVVEKKTIGVSELSDEKIVYLTFDDGPSKLTKEVLDILDTYDAKATFFVTGLNPEYFPLIKEASDRGHSIGLHTYSHAYQDLYTSPDAYYQDLDKIGQVCKELLGYVPHYIRFPGGASNTISKKYNEGIMTFLSEDVLDQGYQFYDWDVSSGDASGGTVSKETIISNATVATWSNITILLHDAGDKQTTVDALPSIIEYYKEKGYRFDGIHDDSFVSQHPIFN